MNQNRSQMRVHPILLCLILSSCFVWFGCAPDPASEFTTKISGLPRGSGPVGSGPVEWREVKYDVKKTDSLVRPYLATVSALVYETDNQLTKESVIELRLYYEQGAWRLSGMVEEYRSLLKFEGKFEAYGDRINRNVTEGDPRWIFVEKQLGIRR